MLLDPIRRNREELWDLPPPPTSVLARSRSLPAARRCSSDLIFTPFCTRCYDVEHENKKTTLPQVCRVSTQQLVNGSPVLL